MKLLLFCTVGRDVVAKWFQNNKKKTIHIFWLW